MAGGLVVPEEANNAPDDLAVFPVDVDIDYDQAFGGGMDQFTVRCRLLVSHADDRTGQAVAQLNLADARRRLSRYEQSIPHYRRTLELSREVGWLDGEATALSNISGAYLFLGRLPQDVRELDEVLGQAPGTLLHLDLIQGLEGGVEGDKPGAVQSLLNGNRKEKQ